MHIVRYCLLIISLLLAALIFILSIGSGVLLSLGPIVALLFLGTNAFYVLNSSSKIKSSDILHRAADYSAFMTLEIKHQANEAKEREARSEQQRLEEIENNGQRLSVAKEFLEFVRTNSLLKRHYEIGAPQIAARSEAMSDGGSNAPDLAALPSPGAVRRSREPGPAASPAVANT